MVSSAARGIDLRTRVLLPFALTLLTIPAIAQQPASTPPLPVYDVVSIHPHRSGDDSIDVTSRDGSFMASNVSLKNLISEAYGIREDLISGLPGWADSARFDITAKTIDPNPSALKNLTRKQNGAMLRPILIDRFQVKVHNEIKTLPVFDLVLLRSGPKFQKSSPPTNNPNHPVPDGQPSPGGVWIHNYDLTATAIPLSTLADVLADQLDRTVIDKTGLTGLFDLKLKWTPDRLLNNAADDGSQNLPPSLFTALQEQLGLKLDSSKGPVETLIVDHAEKPSPN
jgi:uncharacterized protein (TIGR03435 family)